MVPLQGAEAVLRGINMQKTMEKGNPAKPGMRIGDNWLVMSIFRAAISNAPATERTLDKLRALCGNSAIENKYGKLRMQRLLDLASKDEFSTNYTIIALNQYSKDNLFDIDEHIRFLDAYSKDQLAAYVPLFVKKFRAMSFLENEKEDMEYMLKTGLKKENRACVHAITEIFSCIYNFKAGKADYKEVIETGKETMDAW